MGEMGRNITQQCFKQQQRIYFFFHFYAFLINPRDTHVTLLILSQQIRLMADLLLETKWSLLAASALIKTPIEPILPPCMRTRLVQVKYRAADRQSGPAQCAKIQTEVQQNTPTLLTSTVSFCILLLIPHFVYFWSQNRAAPCAVWVKQSTKSRKLTLAQ